MKMKQFKDLLKLNQLKLKSKLKKELFQFYDVVYDEDGFLYAQGEIPVLLVAHMDTVHKETPKMILIEKGKISSPQGIGGDDRCGIAMILDVIKTHKCSVLFTEDEEVGGIGASKFTNTELAKSLISKFNFIIEFDRKGNRDAVFYDCGNEEFENFITQKYFKTNMGSFSDISIVAPYLKTAAVNLSCGYYNAHTTKEYIVWDEMLKVIEEAKWLLDKMDETKYEYVENQYRYLDGNYDFYDSIGIYTGFESLWGIDYEDGFTLGFAEVFAFSKEEAIGKFLMKNEHLTYRNVLWVEEFEYDSFK